MERILKMNKTIKKYLKDNPIEDIINDYVEHNNLDYEDIDGLSNQCEEHIKSIKDSPEEHFETPPLTQEDIDHATKYGYNPFDQERLKMKDKELKKHNNLKWTLKDELEMLTIDELLEIQKLIVSFYDKEVKDER